MTTSIPYENPNMTPKYVDDKIELDECIECHNMVDSIQINTLTEYRCIECQQITYCICGEDIKKCKVCNPSFVDKWIKRFENLYNWL